MNSAAKLTVSGLPSASTRITLKQKPALGRCSRVVVRAEQVQDPPKLTFGANDRSALGYTEEDSAGQTNIFAVEPKIYVAGSSRDTTTDAAGNTTFAAIAAVLGFSVLGLGLAFLKSQPAAQVQEEEVVGNFESLSQYKAKFQAELPSAPAPAED